MRVASTLAADARILWRLFCGQPRQGSHAERLNTFYAPQAERYDAFRSRLLHGRSELLNDLVIRPSAHVVELGCGTGITLELLGSRVNYLRCIDLVDLCPALLDVARKRAANVACARVHEADATTWQPEHPVDVVIVSYALTMIPDWQKAIDNIVAMLAPEGQIAVVDFHLPSRGSRLFNWFWRSWFGHDGVRLSTALLARLRQRFPMHRCLELRAPVPYLPGLRAPYFRFVARRAVSNL